MTPKDALEEPVDMDIASLPKVGPVTEKKLKSRGIETIMDLVNRGPREVADITGIDIDMADRAIQAAATRLEESGLMRSMFSSMEELDSWKSRTEYLRTGCAEFDRMFQGSLGPECAGIPTNAVTMVWGTQGSGKTQLCTLAAFRALLPRDRGGLDTDVVFMDCENIFPHLDLEPYAEHVGMPLADCKGRITLASPINTGMQVLALDRVEAMAREGTRAIIIDGAMTHARHEFPGDSEHLRLRGRFMRNFGGRLKRIAETYNAMVLFSNQVVKNPRAFQGTGNEEEPYGGDILRHLVTYNIKFRMPSQKPRTVCHMYDSPRHNRNEYMFYTGLHGPQDEEVSRERVKKPKKAGQAAGEDGE